ncbi:MAG: hypothetical protein IJT34_02335, partial [Butyrivibrio sp.]|nr:hypothetical protein [Butyrivibrio sp.]
MDEYTREAVTISLDLPGNMQITPVLELDAVTDGLKIDMDTTGARDTLRASYITVAGSQEWECPGWISTQALIVTIPAGVRIKEIYYRQSGYPAEQAGVFSCDDESLNQLWQESFNTLCICMRDNFMDCPDRERAQWWADVTSQMHEMFYTLDSRAELLYRKGVDTVIGWTSQDPSDTFYHVLKTVVPSNDEIAELPQQELYGIVGFWLYYLYTGQKDFLYEVYQPAVDYLKLWEMGTDGLVRHRDGTWDWSDWGNNQDSTVLENAWYYWCLTTLEKMAGVLGMEEPWLRETADTVAAGYESLWVDGAGYTTTAVPDDRGNALAVLSGLAPASRYPVILGVLQNTFKASAYMEVYVLRAMCAMGYVSEALDRMQSRYGNMVSVNQEKGISTLWEYFEEGMGTYNHAWSAGGVYLLPAWVGGVRPTAPGWETCVIAPDFSHSDRVSVTVSTVKGIISVSGTAQALEITLPEGVTAEVQLPGLEPRTVSGAGTHTVEITH